VNKGNFISFDGGNPEKRPVDSNAGLVPENRKGCARVEGWWKLIEDFPINS
jgi:hypothetical protein